MQDSEFERKARLRELASKLFFSLEEQSSGYSLYRDVDVKNPVRHEALTLEAVYENGVFRPLGPLPLGLGSYVVLSDALARS